MSATYSMMEASFSAHGDELLSPSQASVLLPTHVYARLAWSQENNRKKQMEQRAQEEHRRILEERARALYRKTQGDRASRAGLDRAAVEAAHQRNWQIAQQERRIQKEKPKAPRPTCRPRVPDASLQPVAFVAAHRLRRDVPR